MMTAEEKRVYHRNYMRGYYKRPSNKKWRRDYYQAHRDKILDYQHKYYAENKDSVLAKHSEYRARKKLEAAL